MTDIYIDADACPVREEIYRVAARLRLVVFVVSNGSRPVRPPGTSNVRMVLGGGLDPFKDTKTEVILEPAEYRTGKVIEPYNDAQK